MYVEDKIFQKLIMKRFDLKEYCEDGHTSKYNFNIMDATIAKVITDNLTIERENNISFVIENCSTCSDKYHKSFQKVYKLHNNLRNSNTNYETALKNDKMDAYTMLTENIAVDNILK
jgi:hypothetical protein